MIFGILWFGVIIIGGLLFGFLCKVVIEFLFFLVMLIMVGVVVYFGYVYCDLFCFEDLLVFVVGFVILFVFVMLVVCVLLKFIGNYSYVVFVWYWIVFGLLILVIW